MPPKKILIRAGKEDDGKRLDSFLAEKLPEALAQEVSKAKVRKLVVAGAVYLNGKRVRIASKTIVGGARVEAFVDLEKLRSDGRSQDKPFEMSQKSVLFEDEWIIVVDKPPGLPTQATLDEARDNLYAAVKRFIAKRDGVAQPYVGLHHRLDRDTSGVVLFTKKAEANKPVAALFSEHLAVKVYNAISAPGTCPATWEIKNHLGRADGPKKQSKYTAVRSGGDWAHTEFRLLEKLAQGLWIEARPKTGRTHQIRVHLSEDGKPILGDATYGYAAGAPRLMLHAVSLTFPHPISRTELSIQSPLPEDFRRCLQSLRASL